MSQSISSVLEKLEPIAAGIVAEHAARVDQQGAFPQASIDALASAGLLGVVSAESVGGAGLGPKAAALVVERLGRECGSTAMVVCMHYAGTAVLEKTASEAVRNAAASGRHLSTLAFSEVGSRSQFWAPVSTATLEGGKVRLQARKSWVTSASRATAYVWSSKPLAGNGASTLWLVPQDTKGLTVQGPFDGLGLRGNDSSPVVAEGALIDESARLGPDGGGFDLMMGVVLPYFSAMNAACSVGLMESAIARTTKHAAGTRFEHANSAVAELPTVRAFIARMRVRTDMARTLWLDTLEAMETGRADAQLRVLECKAACNDAALEVTELAMRVGGGAAFRKEVGVERAFRDARAGAVMAPTADVLYDFIGKAVCGLPLF